MRAALLHQWPALSRLFGLHPWDVDRLTFDELRAYLEHFEEIAAARARAAVPRGSQAPTVHVRRR